MTTSGTEEARQHVLALLQESGSTVLVKGLQAIELQRAMTSVGFVSMFEAALQRALGVENGFCSARAVLQEGGHADLEKSFADTLLAINVLKHGAGRSHSELLARRNELPFKVRAEDEVFEEGDLSELDFLVRADDEFFHHCAAIVGKVVAEIRALRPEIVL